MKCLFSATTKGTPCSRCGYKLNQDYKKKPLRNCPSRCVHLGEPTGATVDVECVLCGGKRGIVPYAVSACAVYGETLRDYRCTKDALSEALARPIAVCWQCEEFRAAGG